MENRDKNTFIKEIIDSVFSLPSPKLREARKDQVSNLIHAIINGDEIKRYIATPVSINKERRIYIYILTDNRLIILDISANSNKINTYPFSISEMQKVVFNSPELDKISVEVSLSNNQLLGLEYPVVRRDVTSFFQELDELIKNNSM